jgi:hypothetical protein
MLHRISLTVELLAVIHSFASAQFPLTHEKDANTKLTNRTEKYMEVHMQRWSRYIPYEIVDSFFVSRQSVNNLV